MGLTDLTGGHGPRKDSSTCEMVDAYLPAGEITGDDGSTTHRTSDDRAAAKIKHPDRAGLNTARWPKEAIDRTARNLSRSNIAGANSTSRRLP